MDVKQPTPAEIRLLWPELPPDDEGNIDDETAVLAERRAKTFRLFGRGLSMRKIAEEQRCSPATVCRDVHSVVGAWRLIAVQDAAAHVARELIRLAAIEAELWDAWERSKGEATETYTGRRDGKVPTNEARVRKKQRDGSPHIMKLILDAWRDRCKLLGLLRTDDVANKGGQVPCKMVAGVNPEELV